MKPYSLLLVDDDPFILSGIGEDLETRGYRVTRAESGEKAVALLEHFRFDLVITDLVMDNTDGIQVLHRSKQLNPNIKVIILTGFGDMTSAIDALRYKADDYLLKPCESEEMMYRVKRCLKKLEVTRKFKQRKKLLPICCVCKKVRTPSVKGPGTSDWITVEEFIHSRSRLDITSSYCLECAKKTMTTFNQTNHLR